MEFVLILAVVLAVAAFVSAPLRRADRGEASEQADAGALADLEAAKEAKYGEIRDAELDFRTGKLSQEDHRALDAQLRGEAIELLRSIDAVRERSATTAVDSG
jgi:hypothetical protein